MAANPSRNCKSNVIYLIREQCLSPLIRLLHTFLQTVHSEDTTDVSRRVCSLKYQVTSSHRSVWRRRSVWRETEKEIQQQWTRNVRMQSMRPQDPKGNPQVQREGSSMQGLMEE